MNRSQNLAAGVALIACLSVASSASANLYFSEYIEGSSNNKVLEIFNPTAGGVNLTGWEIKFYFNGNTSAGTTIALDAVTLGSGDVWVVSENNASAGILALADQTSTSSFFNGDDAIELIDPLANVVDVIGQVGTDPGSEWSGGGVGTQNETIRRKNTVTSGDSNGADAFDPSVEWTGFAIDTIDGLGSHDGSVEDPGTVGTVMIAMQDFNSLDSTSTFTADQFPIGSIDEPLTNTGAAFTGAGDANHPGGVGAAFATLWTDSEGDVGPRDNDGENGDFIGVNAFTGSDAPNVAADGTPVSAGTEHNFQFNDADGILELVFAPVDVSGFGELGLVLDYWINDTSYEGDDALIISVSDGTDTQILLNLDDAGLAASVSADDSSANWNSLAAPITLDGTMLTLTIAVVNTAGPENIFVDNIAFKGTVIPTPAALPAGLIGLITLASRRRRLT